MRRLRDRFSDELVVIGVHAAKFLAEQLTPNIRQALLRQGITHPVVNDAGFEIWEEYTIQAWPTVVLIDPGGKIVDTEIGEIMAAEYAPKIEALIADFEARSQLDRRPLELQPERKPDSSSPLAYPSRLLPSLDQHLFIADTGHHRLLEVVVAEDYRSGEIRRIFGTGEPGFEDGPAGQARFHDPHGLARRDDTLYVADTGNHAIRAIDLKTQIVRTVAGTGQKAHGRFSLGDPTTVPLRSPWAVWAEDHILVIAMAGSHQIWVLVDETRLGIFAGSGAEALLDGPLDEAGFNQPSDLSFGMGHLLVADTEAGAIRAVWFGDDARVLTLIGQGLFEFGDVDGVGAEVRLQHPAGLTFRDNLIYIADSYNHKIKTLDPSSGTVQTLIGTGQPGHSDGPFTQAELFEPEGVMAAGDHLFIADTNNHQVRVANLQTGMIHTLNL